MYNQAQFMTFSKQNFRIRLLILIILGVVFAASAAVFINASGQDEKIHYYYKDFLDNEINPSYIIDGANSEHLAYFENIEGLMAAYDDLGIDNHRIYLAVLAENTKPVYDILLPEIIDGINKNGDSLSLKMYCGVPVAGGICGKKISQVTERTDNPRSYSHRYGFLNLRECAYQTTVISYNNVCGAGYITGSYTVKKETGHTCGKSAVSRITVDYYDNIGHNPDFTVTEGDE